MREVLVPIKPAKKDKKMGEVIGLGQSAQERATNWITMRFIRDSLKHYHQIDPDKYKSAIKKEKSIYSDILKEYVGPAKEN